MVEDGQRKLMQKLRENDVTFRNKSVSQVKNKNSLKTVVEKNHKIIGADNVNDGIQTASLSLANTTSSSTFPKRVGKKKKCFPCDPSSYFEGEQIDVGLGKNINYKSKYTL